VVERCISEFTIVGSATRRECIHEWPIQLGAVRTMRTMAGEQAAVIVMDEPVGGSFAARNEDTEWFMYGFSVLHCLPASLADIPSAATGTVMRPATPREYAANAGFRDLRIPRSRTRAIPSTA